MKNILNYVVVAVIALVIGYAVSGMTSEQRFGATTNFSGLTVGTSGLVVNGSTTLGSSGTAIGTIIHGQFTASSCTGSSTQPIGATVTYSCSVTGAANGDRVFVTLASTTPTWVVLSAAYASTTASNNVRVVLLHASSTGAFASATTTGAKYLIVR